MKAPVLHRGSGFHGFSGFGASGLTLRLKRRGLRVWWVGVKGLPIGPKIVPFGDYLIEVYSKYEPQQGHTLGPMVYWGFGA